MKPRAAGSFLILIKLLFLLKTFSEKFDIWHCFQLETKILKKPVFLVQTKDVRVTGKQAIEGRDDCCKQQLLVILSKD